MDFYRRKAPNLALLLFLSLPIIAGVVVGLSSANGQMKPGAVPAAIVAMVCALLAAVPIAARLQGTPLVVSVLCALMMLVPQIILRAAAALVDYPLSGGMSFEVFGALGLMLVWVRTDVYVRPINPPSRLVEFVHDGLRQILANDRFAGVRAIGGLGVSIVGLTIMFLPTATRSELFISNWLLRVIAAGGLSTLASALRLRDAYVPGEEPGPHGGGRGNSPSGLTPEERSEAALAARIAELTARELAETKPAAPASSGTVPAAAPSTPSELLAAVRAKSASDPNGAIAQAQEELRRFPRAAPLSVELSLLYRKVGRTEEALALAPNAIALALEESVTPLAISLFEAFWEDRRKLTFSAETAERLARVLAELNRRDEALFCFAASRTAGGDPIRLQKGMLALAEASAKAGELERAIFIYEVILKAYPDSSFAEFCTEQLRVLRGRLQRVG